MYIYFIWIKIQWSDYRISISNESSNSNSLKNDQSENYKAGENVPESKFDENESKQIIHEKEEIISSHNDNNQVIIYPPASYTPSSVIDYSQLASVPAEIRAKEFKHDIANVFYFNFRMTFFIIIKTKIIW
jgi:hypothetical protein